MDQAELKPFSEVAAVLTPYEIAHLRIASFAALKGWGSQGEDGKWKTWNWGELEGKAEVLVRWATSNPIRCNFCGKSQHEVKTIVTGASAFACDECITLMTEIIKEKQSIQPAEGEGHEKAAGLVAADAEKQSRGHAP